MSGAEALATIVLTGPNGNNITLVDDGDGEADYLYSYVYLMTTVENSWVLSLGTAAEKSILSGQS